MDLRRALARNGRALVKTEAASAARAQASCGFRRQLAKK